MKDKHAIAQAMIEHGGSFAHYIGKALLHADPDNEAILAKAFKRLIKKYRALSRMLKEEAV